MATWDFEVAKLCRCFLSISLPQFGFPSLNSIPFLPSRQGDLSLYVVKQTDKQTHRKTTKADQVGAGNITLPVCLERVVLDHAIRR